MATNAIIPSSSKPSNAMRHHVIQPGKTARESLKRHGKSFSWAAAFLGRHHTDCGARLYEICRAIDDMADENPTPDAKRLLTALRQGLMGGLIDEAEALAVAHNINHLENMIRLDRTALMHLIDGVEQDLMPVRLADERALIRYAYHVAGSVGLMMCDVLNVRDPVARRYAIDMGIAMQLTNIARDVLEDAERGRRYIPAAWLDVTPEELLNPSAQTKYSARQAIDRMLMLADQYYASGHAGLRYLPARPRLAIAIAAAVYREIGQSLRKAGSDYQQGRVVVPGWRKALITLRVVLNPVLCFPRTSPHDITLHAALDGLITPQPTDSITTDSGP